VEVTLAREDVDLVARPVERREERQPRTWSQWVWLMRIEAVPLPSPNAPSMRDFPSRRRPVPASMMIGSPPRGRTSTQDVFPPYRLVARPGTGMEPRTPQNLTFI
jgi:hypothetical protein